MCVSNTLHDGTECRMRKAAREEQKRLEKEALDAKAAAAKQKVE